MNTRPEFQRTLFTLYFAALGPYLMSTGIGRPDSPFRRSVTGIDTLDWVLQGFTFDPLRRALGSPGVALLALLCVAALAVATWIAAADDASRAPALAAARWTLGLYAVLALFLAPTAEVAILLGFVSLWAVERLDDPEVAPVLS